MNSEAVEGDWKNQLPADTRPRIVNKILETLKRHLPYSDDEGLRELEKIAVRFEERIYSSATSQSDYLRKISLKMLTMETKSQNPMTSPLQPNAVSNILIPQDPDNIRGQAMNSEAVEGDWRSQLPADSRPRIVKKILETLKRRHLPYSDEEGLRELEKIAVRFEEKIYSSATSQSDYLRKISLKMLTMETKSQNPMTSPLQPNAASNSEIPQDPGTQSGN